VGVAPGARLWSVKVLDSRGSGSNAGVAAGLDWVVQHNAGTQDSTGDIEVANLSLTGSKSSVMDDAVARAVSAGVTVVVAAGNDGRDAGTYSPASAPAAITVSALADFNGAPGGGAGYTCYPDVDDTLADYSNYGSVVDVIAPGTCIRSTTMGGGYGTKSGTSMASPHVAGAAALLRSMGKSHATTEAQLKSTGSTAWTGDRDGVKEPLLTVSDSSVFAPALVAQTSSPPSSGLTFTGSSTSQKSSWTATVSVAGGTPGSPYSGIWSVGGGQTSCVADGSGACQVSRTGIAKKVGTVTWTYDGNPATTVTVSKP
jgi:subtilisin family serine protease